MKLTDILLREAAYPGNIGVVEVFKFYHIATDDERETFEDLLQQHKMTDAWDLIQNVTGVHLDHIQSNTGE